MRDIEVHSKSLAELEEAFLEQRDKYETNLQALAGIVEDATTVSMIGDPAVQLKKKYEEKQEIFKAIRETLDRAYELMSRKKREFAGTVENIMDSMQ